MERLGTKTVTGKVELEGEAMSLEVLRKIAIAQIGDNDLDSETVPPRPDHPEGLIPTKLNVGRGFSLGEPLS
jgi:hypothetical protein